jgi:hydroxyacylglutathione hydrolase
VSQFEVKLIPAFEDNYLFVVVDRHKKSCLVVDPGDAVPILSYIEKECLNLEAILLTHQHSDHIGGVSELVQNYSGRPVYGPEIILSQVPWINHRLNGGEKLNLLGLSWDVIVLEGHTLGHLGYYCAERNWFFCGDVLFGLGCGRIFEGTFEMTFKSLNKFKSLPLNTQVYCAHEYTDANMQFSQYLLKNNLMPKLWNEEKFVQHGYEIENLRKAHQPTVPLNLETELKLNPFLLSENVEEFQKIRQIRNSFRPLQRLKLK